MKVTSISITEEQYEYVKKHHIHLSSFLREKLNEWIEENKR